MVDEEQYARDGCLMGCLEKLTLPIILAVGVTSAIFLGKLTCSIVYSNNLRSEPTPIAQEYHGIPSQYALDSLLLSKEAHLMLGGAQELIEKGHIVINKEDSLAKYNLLGF